MNDHVLLIMVALVFVLSMVVHGRRRAAECEVKRQIDSGQVAAAGIAELSGANHVLHLLLTLVTCGLWMPIWLIVAWSNPRRTVVVDERGRTTPV